MYDRKTSVRLTNIIFAAESFNSASRIAIFTILAIVAKNITGNEVVAGFPSTTMTLVQALTALPFGIFMGRVGRRIGLTVGYGVSWLGVLLGLVAIINGWFLMLLAASALLGIGRAGTDQARFAVGDMFPPEERAGMIGRIVFAGTMGAILGPLLVNPGTQLAQYFGISIDTGPYLMAVGFFGISIVITYFFLRPEPLEIARLVGGDEQKKKVDTTEAARPISQLLRLPRVQLAVMSMLISQVVMVTLMVITPLHMNHHNHDHNAVSLVISAHTLGMFGLSLFTGRIIDRFGRVPMMVAGALLLIAAAVVSPLSTSVPVLTLGLFLLGLGWNFGYIAGSSLLGDALQGAERSKMQGTNDMLVAGAAALGSFVSGPIFSVGGYVSVAGIGLVLAILFGWIIWLLAPSEPKIKTA